MKKLFTLFLLMLSIRAASAQNGTISATVVDTDLIAWANGSWKLAFTANPSHPNIGDYNVNGVPLAPGVINQSGSLDASGAFSTSAYLNTAVTPAGSTWTITICPLASAPCGNYKFTLSTSTLDISNALKAAIPAPRFPTGAASYGYADVEVQVSTGVGGQYWNVPLSQFRFWNGSAWVAQGGGGGGTGTPVGNVQELQVNAGSGNFGATTGMTWSPASK